MTAFLYQRSLIAGAGRVTFALLATTRVARPRRARATRSTWCSTRTVGRARGAHPRAARPPASARRGASARSTWARPVAWARPAPVRDRIAGPAARLGIVDSSWRAPLMPSKRSAGPGVAAAPRVTAGFRECFGGSDEVALVHRTRAGHAVGRDYPVTPSCLRGARWRLMRGDATQLADLDGRSGVDRLAAGGIRPSHHWHVGCCSLVQRRRGRPPCQRSIRWSRY